MTALPHKSLNGSSEVIPNLPILIEMECAA